MDELLANVMTAKIDREIDPNPKSLADFGLDKPAADITLTLKDGKTLGLQLGAKNPTGVWVYARERDKPAVFVVGESVLRDATKPVADFRDRTILAFDAKDVTGFEIVLPDETLGGGGCPERRGGSRGRWPCAPTTRPSGEFLDKLAGQKVREFVAETPAARDAYGLERPVRVTIHTRPRQGPGEPDLAARQGRRRQEGRLRDAGRVSRACCWCPRTSDNQVPKNVGVLRNKTLVEIDRDKVARLEIQSPKGAVTVARENGQWKIVAPQVLAADQVEVGAVLTKLHDLRAQGFLGEDAAGVARFLPKPEVQRRGDRPGRRHHERGSGAVHGDAGRGPQRVRRRGGSGAGGAGRRPRAGRSHALGRRPARQALARWPGAQGRQARAGAGRRADDGARAQGRHRVARGRARQGRRPTARRSRTCCSRCAGCAGRRWWRPTARSRLATAWTRRPSRWPCSRATAPRSPRCRWASRTGAVAYIRTKAQPTVFSVESRTLGPAPKVPDDFKG